MHVYGRPPIAWNMYATISFILGYNVIHYCFNVWLNCNNSTFIQNSHIHRLQIGFLKCVITASNSRLRGLLKADCINIDALLAARHPPGIATADRIIAIAMVLAFHSQFRRLMNGAWRPVLIYFNLTAVGKISCRAVAASRESRYDNDCCEVMRRALASNIVCVRRREGHVCYIIGPVFIAALHSTKSCNISAQGQATGHNHNNIMQPTSTGSSNYCGQACTVGSSTNRLVVNTDTSLMPII